MVFNSFGDLESRFWRLLVFILVPLLFFTSSIGRIEGRFYPVANEFTIGSSYRTEGGVNFWGTFHIERDSCDFLGINWYLVGVDGRRTIITPNVEFLSGNTSRTNGDQDYGPWRLNITEQQLQDSAADVLHQCYMFGVPRPWITVTPLKG